MSTIQIGDRIKIISVGSATRILSSPQGVNFSPPIGHEDIVESTPHYYDPRMPQEANTLFPTLKNWFIGKPFSRNNRDSSPLFPCIVPEAYIKI